MGEIVGMAASLCKEHGVEPRSVYRDHLDDLIERMQEGVGKTATPLEALEGVGPNVAPTARITTSGDRDSEANPPSMLNDGRTDWLRNDLRWLSHAQTPNWVELHWDQPHTLAAARVTSGYRSGASVTAPILSFVLQYAEGDTWKDIPGTDTADNTEVAWHRRFQPVTTTGIRLLVRQAQEQISRIWEIELYQPVEP
jgi:hypothetical protein